jgi:hypothetical protein
MHCFQATLPCNSRFEKRTLAEIESKESFFEWRLAKCEELSST